MSLESAPVAEEAPSYDLRSAAAALPGHARFTDEQVEGFYAIGHGYFAQNLYDKAISFLIVASLYRPAEVRYMMALGICQKMLKRHHRAVQAFALAMAIEPDNPEPGLHVAECLLALRRPEEARRLLETVVECTLLSGRHELLRQRAEAMLEWMPA